MIPALHCKCVKPSIQFYNFSFIDYRMIMNVLEPTSRVGVALDLILKTLISSQDFNELQTKNWEAIARLIPGSSPGQVVLFQIHVYLCIGNNCHLSRYEYKNFYNLQHY